jgi:hypothetical protein
MVSTKGSARGRAERVRPGENRVPLFAAQGERAAERIVRSLGIHEIDCSTRADARLEVVEVLVRRSDLSRARRILHVPPR